MLYIHFFAGWWVFVCKEVRNSLQKGIEVSWKVCTRVWKRSICVKKRKLGKKLYISHVTARARALKSKSSHSQGQGTQKQALPSLPPAYANELQHVTKVFLRWPGYTERSRPWMYLNWLRYTLLFSETIMVAANIWFLQGRERPRCIGAGKKRGRICGCIEID